MALEDRQPQQVDEWLDWNWRGLTHPEEFPLIPGADGNPQRPLSPAAKTEVDQRNSLSYALNQLDDVQFRETVGKIEEILAAPPTNYTPPPMPPF